MTPTPVTPPRTKRRVNVYALMLRLTPEARIALARGRLLPTHRKSPRYAP